MSNSKANIKHVPRLAPTTGLRFAFSFPVLPQKFPVLPQGTIPSCP